MQAICRYLGVPLIQAMDRFFTRKDNRHTVREIPVADEFHCLFLSMEQGCTIYPVRPRQCWTFPFWDVFRNAAYRYNLKCPGVRPL